MAKPKISTTLAPKRKRNQNFAQALAGPHTEQSFSEVYSRPGQIKQARAAGRPAPSGGTLTEARTGRKNLAQALLSKPGARKDLQQAYGPGFKQGDLSSALTTLKTAKQKVAAGTAPPELLQSDLVKRARRRSKKFLGIRENFLRSRYTA